MPGRDPRLSRLLALNNAAVPHVNELDADLLAALVSGAALLSVDEDADHANVAPRGFLLAFTPDANYAGFGFQWFRARYDSFLYIDRIIVAESARGTGVGAKLYIDAVEYCRRHGIGSLACEVYDDPPNPGSHAFHRRIGFKAIESLPHPSGNTLRMYTMSLDD